MNVAFVVACFLDLYEYIYIYVYILVHRKYYHFVYYYALPLYLLDTSDAFIPNATILLFVLWRARHLIS